MKILVADCSVIYTGRGDTKLGRGIRAIIIKEDGSISIHNDTGNKPLNYMGKGNVLTIETHDGVDVWSFDTRRESLQIHVHNIISENDFALDEENEGLIRDGTENHLQAWLADNPETFGEGFRLVQREFQTGAGPVDLLMQDSQGNYFVIEVKRIAMLPSVDQVRRYVEALKATEGYESTTGILAALDVRPNTIKLAEKRGIPYVIVPADWNKNRIDFDTPL